MRLPRDRDFVRTKEDLLFCVTGYLHPPDKVTSYLKYVPSPEGKWDDGAKRYDRAFTYYSAKNIFKTFDYLRASYPHYLSFCPVRNMELCMVPRECITRYYLPEERMADIMDSPHDSFEEEVRDFASLLCERSGVEAETLGVTGSILTSMHDPGFSDMDLLVYGRDASRALREALSGMNHPEVRGMDENEMERWISSRTSRFPISRRLATHYCRRRWNYGYFRKRYFSIHPARAPGEVREAYGQHTYRKLGRVQAKVRVIDDSDAIFLPAIFKVEGGTRIDGRDIVISEIVSHEGLYCDAAQEGDVLDVRGTLEECRNSGNQGDRYSIVIGTGDEGEEWIRLAGCE